MEFVREQVSVLVHRKQWFAVLLVYWVHFNAPHCATIIILYSISLSYSSPAFFVFFSNRHVESTVEPRYAPVNQQAHVMAPRALPLGPPTNNGPRRGPLDSSVPYALPQKKNKPKKPRHEPAIGK